MPSNTGKKRSVKCTHVDLTCPIPNHNYHVQSFCGFRQLLFNCFYWVCLIHVYVFVLHCICHNLVSYDLYQLSFHQSNGYRIRCKDSASACYDQSLVVARVYIPRDWFAACFGFADFWSNVGHITKSPTTTLAISFNLAKNRLQSSICKTSIQTERKRVSLMNFKNITLVQSQNCKWQCPAMINGADPVENVN